MNQSFLYQSPTFLIAIVLFIIMMITYRLGHLLKQSHVNKGKVSSEESLGPIEGSLLGLLALLLSFTFGMSASRYDDRRQIIVEEANDIGTAILRCDMYPDSIKKQLKSNFKDYVEARIEYYNAGIDVNKIEIAKSKTEKRSKAIWNIVMAESQKPENILRSQQMIPALNSMIDDITTRDEVKNATVPESIFWLLFLLIFSASFIIGYSSKGKKINHVLVYGFSLMTTLTVFLILDLDRPRRGLINSNNTEQNIVELRELFKE